MRDCLIACGVLGSSVVALVVFCGGRTVGYPQPPPRREHGCTVGIDWDPRVWHLHPGRMTEVPERQLLLHTTSATSDNTPYAFGKGITDRNQDPLKGNFAGGTV